MKIETRMTKIAHAVAEAAKRRLGEGKPFRVYVKRPVMVDGVSIGDDWVLESDYDSMDLADARAAALREQGERVLATAAVE